MKKAGDRPLLSADQVLADSLRAAGLKATIQRLAIARILIESPGPLSSGEILQALPDKSLCDKATVYRVLLQMENRGLVHRIELGGVSRLMWISPTSKAQSFIVCRACFKTAPFSLPKRAVEDLSESAEFPAFNDKMYVIGTCHSCAKKQKRT